MAHIQLAPNILLIYGQKYSFHSNSQGFACDSVVNFEVVLADGSIVNANPRENPDLYKSLKGGSGNFGFVTRVDQSKLPVSVKWVMANRHQASWSQTRCGEAL